MGKGRVDHSDERESAKEALERRATYPVQPECRGRGGEGINRGQTMKPQLGTYPGRNSQSLDSDLCF